MILQCPECAARYLVPDRSIPKNGRHVRCAKCNNTWHFRPPTRVENEALSELDKLLNEINARPTGLAKGANLPALRGMASFSQRMKTFAAAFAALVMILANFSPEWIGIPPSKGLMLTDVGFVKIAGESQNAYQITGRISNITGRIMSTPVLRITLVDDEGSSLQYWEFEDDQDNIGPWNKIPFDIGPLEVTFQRGSRFVVEIGSPLEMALRRKPAPVPPSTVEG